MRKVDTAVIGGGMAGFLAAVELSKANKSVVLLEKSGQFGGRAMTVNKKGALFNLGGHALYRGGEAYAMLQEFGVKLDGGVPLAAGSAIWRDSLVPLPGDPLTLLTSKLLSLPEKFAFGRFMIRLGRLNAAAMPAVSLRVWAESEIRLPMVRHLFYALCRTATYSRDIDYQLTGPVIQQIQRSLKSSVLYIDGGWQSIIHALRGLAEAGGVTVLNHQHVREIEYDNRVRKLRMECGDTLEVDKVISTLSPAETIKLLRGDAEHTALHRWAAQARPITAACLDLCLRKLPVAGRHFAIGIDQPVFFTNHSRAAKLSGDGSVVVHLIKYNGPGRSDSALDRALLEDTMSQLHPGWQKEVVAEQYLPHITVAGDHMHTGRTDLRPGPAVPEIGGLYAAGDWASHGEMLVDAAAASARRAVQQLLREESHEQEPEYSYR
ncbi:phytoene desaturase family protein [Paenibacillus solisilvae]|uniref:Phytoene desaturase family protein n=1 Tax=Paenibacillus solisilvae TaxID=2486751 RepID=A0ABW0W639_9BACL